ncbi:gamma-glutamyl-gamma-aminobutyrate hydrolase family protein [Salinibacter ruber]|uniref:gamma-glutamyl-gamma-aminobutyrate hydrolase family protein n=1 Tax=Salinibacter ruber TaxID=146919 RepID=UPI0021685B32
MPAHIGITTAHTDGTQRLDRRYTAAIENAGGVPVVLPITESDRTVEETLGRIDGLVVPGGTGRLRRPHRPAPRRARRPRPATRRVGPPLD